MQTEAKTLVCIVCPTGCSVNASYNGEELILEGNLCENGAVYVTQELTNPVRMLTTTVSLIGNKFQRLAVRTSGPIPKDFLFPAMEIIKNISVQSPVKRGQVIINNLLNTGFDVIASCDR